MAICTWIVIETVFTVAKVELEKARCAFLDEYILETIAYLMEYYSPFKKNELLRHRFG